MVNDYDKYAAERQEKLKKGLKLPHRYVEKPAMKRLLPDLKGKKVLLLGCGTGEETMLLEEFGAELMTGIDLSEESIRLASETYKKHTFRVMDMHNVNFADETFDFIYSSLTIHYSAEPIKVYEEMLRLLKPGGTFQFSIGHPMRWASERIELDGKTTKVMGYTEGNTAPRLYGNYSGFNKYEEMFPSGEVLSFWIGSPSMHFGLLKQAGFKVEEFIETKAIDECKEVDMNYYLRFSNFPQFTVFSVTKPQL